MKKILISFVIGIMLLSFTSAFNFDNAKSYDPTTKEVTITNSFGIGGELMKVKLIENTERCSVDCHAIMEITNNEEVSLGNSYDSSFNFEFNDLLKGGQKLINPTFELSSTRESKDIVREICDYKVLDDKLNITEKINCKDIIDGTNIVYDWKSFDWKGGKLPIGTYYLKIQGTKEPNDVIDWVPTFIGARINEWALWNSVSALLNFTMDNTANYSQQTGTSAMGIASFTGGSGLLNGCKAGRCYNFTTATASLGSIGITPTFGSWSFWFNKTGDAKGQIFSASAGAGGYQILILEAAYGGDADKMRFYFDSASGDVKSTALADNIWYHVVVKCNNTGGYIYLNGYKNASDTSRPAGNCKFFSTTASQNSFFGTGAAQFSLAWMDEAKFYDTEISDAQVLQLYQNPTGLSGSTITQNSPSDNYNTTLVYNNFNCTATMGVGATFRNMSLWTNKTGTFAISNSTTTNGGNIGFSLNSSSPTKYIWGCRGCDTDGDCGISANKTIGFDRISSNTYNATSYITSLETYTINVSGASSVSLVYDSTDYPATLNGEIASKTLILPTSVGNKSFFWKVDSGNYNSSTYYQDVKDIQFGLCNATNNITYVNISFQDENTLANINGTLQTAIFNYGFNGVNLNKTYTLSSTSYNASYTFCFTPGNRAIDISPSITYLGTNYPARFYARSLLTLTNTTTNIVLYLLNLNDGIYTTFVTVSQSNTPIANSDIVITRDILGSVVTIAQGVTDGSGGYTAWLNPNYEHTVTASKTGYGTNTQLVRPTQSTYTLVMSSSGNYTYVSNFDGLSWGIFPVIGFIQSGITNFGFNITSRTANIVSCKIEIINSSKSVLTSGETIATNGSICSAIVSYNPVANGYSQINGRLLINTGTGYQILEDDAAWRYLAVNSTGMTLSDWFNSFNSTSLSPTYFNNDEGHRSYTYIIIFFLLVTILTAVLNSMGFDLTSPGAMLWLIGLFVFMASIGGFLDLTGSLNTPFAFVNKYFIAIIYSMFMIGYLARSFS